jgi:hypothetical protein
MVTVMDGRRLPLTKQQGDRSAKVKEPRFKLRDLSDENDRMKYKMLLEVVRMDYVQRGPDTSKHVSKVKVPHMQKIPNYAASLEAFNERYFSDAFFGPDASPLSANQLDAVPSWSAF